MPTYDYECPKCGHRFERFQGINDPPVKICPKCRGRKVRRLIGTGAGIIFKGSGFYATDYRSDGYRRAARSDSGGNGNGGGSGGDGAKSPAEKKDKSETKPAASASTKNTKKGSA